MDTNTKLIDLYEKMSDDTLIALRESFRLDMEHARSLRTVIFCEHRMHVIDRIIDARLTDGASFPTRDRRSPGERS